MDDDRNALAWHITMRLRRDRVIASSPAALRDAARTVIARGRTCGLLAFCVADNHLHAIVACSREAAGQFARVVEQSIQLRLQIGIPFERARFRAIVRTSHLAHAVPYVLKQALHHGARHDPGFDGCSILDLFGLRVLDLELPRRVQRHLPRLTRETAAPWFPRLTGVTVELGLLRTAAAAAVGAAELRGNTPLVAAARRAAIHFAEPSVGIEDAAALLDMTIPAARRLRSRPAQSALVRAIRAQLALQTYAAEISAYGIPDENDDRTTWGDPSHGA